MDLKSGSTKPEVSFILGILNAEKVIKECLESILFQKFPPEKYEILVIDGGSTDRTLKIVQEASGTHPIRLFHNPGKLSEGRGMSKDMGVSAALGEIVIFLDHDNILLEKDWLFNILRPFRNPEVMASQSMLQSRKGDGLFLRYVNDIGVEDPFAVPYSLVAQVQLRPGEFPLEEGDYHVHKLNPKKVLFGGANGCAFRKEVFGIIGGYTRDVDVFAAMAEHRMVVAIPLKCRVYHKTGANLLTFLYKKGVYFYRFINSDVSEKKFEWVPKNLKGKLWFASMVAYNLSVVLPMLFSALAAFRTGKLAWLLHPFYLFLITAEYGLITLTKLPNFIRYSLRRS
jgi:glycosyltransferase involved in cell wall biosynthesis